MAFPPHGGQPFEFGLGQGSTQAEEEFMIPDEPFDIIGWYPHHGSCVRYFLDHAQYDSAVQMLARFINIRLPFQKVHGAVLSSESDTSPPRNMCILSGHGPGPGLRPGSSPDVGLGMGLASMGTGMGAGMSFRAAAKLPALGDQLQIGGGPHHTGTSPHLGSSSSGGSSNNNDERGKSVYAAAGHNHVSLIPYIRRLVATGFDIPAVLLGFFGHDWARGVGRWHEQERRNYMFMAKSSNFLDVKSAYDMGEDEMVPFLKPPGNVTEEEIVGAERTWSDWLAFQDWMVGPRAPEMQEGGYRGRSGILISDIAMSESGLGRLAQWAKLVARAKSERLDTDVFAKAAALLHRTAPLPPPFIADLLLHATARDCYILDLRVPWYVQALRDQELLDSPAILQALYTYSSVHSIVPQDAAPDGQGGAASAVVKTEGGVAKEGGLVKTEDGTGKPTAPTTSRPQQRWENSYAAEEHFFWRLAKDVPLGTAVRTRDEAVEVLKWVARWMKLFNDAAAVFSAESFAAIQHFHAKEDLERSKAGFGRLVLSLFQHDLVMSYLSKPTAKGLRKLLFDGLETFALSLMQTSPEVGDRLEMFRTQKVAALDPANAKKNNADAALDSIMDMDNLMPGLDSLDMADMPMAYSRAGLYIYFSAALVGRPLVGDNTLFMYLHNRYQGDLQMTAIQLILASFDVLANAVFHNETSKAGGHMLKSFVVNKVPLILGSLAAIASASMMPFNSEYCVTQALGQVDTNVFPTLSSMFDMSNTNTSFHGSVRQDFCFACQLHGLLPEAAIGSLLGDITYQSLPAEGRYVKEVLVQSCLQDPERTLKLIGELDSMNGNVGAAAQAIMEVISSLCRSKETMALKQLCGQLTSNPPSLDILLLFEKPSKILNPLRELLDNWRYDEDQGEYQPVYEEFGSVLLLLLAFVYRYGLTPADLGIRPADAASSFVGKLITNTQLYNKPLGELSDREKSHLNGWIHGLFDSEAGGLGDELMSSCPPQDFYLLVPTLFHQILLALSQQMLTAEMLKGGLEYLVDILLLPSLVPAILYLTSHLGVDDQPMNNPRGPNLIMQLATIKILQLIIQPTSISNEASSMLSSVLTMVAKPLEHALRSFQRQEPRSQEVEPLRRALLDKLALSRRTGAASHNELESWTSSSGSGPQSNTHGQGSTQEPQSQGSGRRSGNGIGHHGSSGNGNANEPTLGLAAAIRTTTQGFIQWAQHPESGTPTTYTHRQMLAAVKILGARRVLGELLDVLVTITSEAGAGGGGTSTGGEGAGKADELAIAYDVITSLVCAPDVTCSGDEFPSAPPPVDGESSKLEAENKKASSPSPSDAALAQVQRRLSLREALRLEAEDWRRLHKRDAARAEATVRLHRRVEAQMAVVPVLVPPPVGVMVANQQMHPGHPDDPQAHQHHQDNMVGVGVSVDGLLGGDPMGLDSVGGVAVDLTGLDVTGATAGAGMGMGVGSGADDIFSGLGGVGGPGDFGTDFGAGWDAMDLG